MYDGWRTVTIVWLNGISETIQALGRPEPWVRDNTLHIRVSDDNQYRHIPLTAIREWRMRKYE